MCVRCHPFNSVQDIVVKFAQKSLKCQNFETSDFVVLELFCILRAKEESEVVEKLQNDKQTQPTVQQTPTLALRQLVSSYFLEQNTSRQNSSTLSVTVWFVELHHFLEPLNNTPSRKDRFRRFGPTCSSFLTSFC